MIPHLGCQIAEMNPDYDRNIEDPAADPYFDSFWGSRHA